MIPTVTKGERAWLLPASRCPGSFAARLFRAVVPAEVIAAWRGAEIRLLSLETFRSRLQGVAPPWKFHQDLRRIQGRFAVYINKLLPTP